MSSPHSIWRRHTGGRSAKAIQNTLCSILVYSIVVMLLLLATSSFVTAAVCNGNAIPCSCGDTLMTSKTLTAADPVTTTTCTGTAGIIIGNRNVLLNCNGRTIQGSGTGTGIVINGYNSVMVRNCNIAGFDTDVGVQRSAGSFVWNSNLSSASRGVALAIGAENTYVANNTFTNIGMAGISFSVGANTNGIESNNFYSKGIQAGPATMENQTFCVQGRGNYYAKEIFDAGAWNNIGWNDCGPPRITGTYPGWQAGYHQYPFQVNWTRQSSQSANMTYYVEMWNGTPPESWKRIAFTKDTNTLFDTDTLSNLPSYHIRVIPWNGIVNGTPNMTAPFAIKTRGMIQGTVAGCTGGVLPNAAIWLFNSTPWRLQNITQTSASGSFEFRNLRYNNYTVVVNYTGHTNARRDVLLQPAPPAVRVDFAVGEVCPLTSECMKDCTRKGQELCDASCNGVNGCNFQPKCAGLRRGLRVFVNETLDAVCCTNESYVQKASGIAINVPSQNVARMTSVINFRDAFKYVIGAKMHVIVYKKQ